MTVQEDMARGPWTKEEDENLRTLVLEQQQVSDAIKWSVVALQLRGRSSKQCRERWANHVNPPIPAAELNRGPWSKDEDALLKSLVDHQQKISDTIKWSVVAIQLRNRNSKQCRERWLNHLNPRVRKGEWSVEEEQIFLEAHKRLGNAWSEIAKL